MTGMMYRTLGTTGEKVSILGLGGSHIGSSEVDSDGAIRIIRRALDAGVNFLDNCWDYHDGESERRMGKALKDGYRRKAFLMSKIDGRTKKSAQKQIDESLKRLKTDCIDLMQHHEIIRFDDPDRIFAEGGAMEAFVESKAAGKIRYIGFTGHKDPQIHLYMLAVAADHGFRFDAVQMPLNVMDAHFRSFEHLVLPRLVTDGVGALGMKSLGGGVILKSKVVSALECLHYAMSLPASVVITGIDSEKILDQALEAVRTFHPLSDQERSTILHRTGAAARRGEFELFKTSRHFDGTVEKPEWLGEEPEQIKKLAS